MSVLEMNPASTITINDRIVGVLIGTAVGDAMGLPAEGLSSKRIKRWWHGEWKHRLIFGRGMVSDDTEHTLFVAQALLKHPNSAEIFQQCLAWKFRWWLLGIPAGIGLATLRSILKLWLGFPPSRSGVWSAGNGPAMRSAIIGAFFADDLITLREFTKASTQLTHTDPKAETAALAIALVVAQETQASGNPTDVIAFLLKQSDDGEWKSILNQIAETHRASKNVQDFARQLGQESGVSGYSYHTVPIAIYAWLRHYGDFRTALTSALDCGGDTDTVGAIVGALAGASVGQGGIPLEFQRGIAEWPRSLSLLKNVGTRLAEQKMKKEPLGSVGYFWPFLPVRNFVFIVTVLFHGFRRLFPPY